MMGLMAMVRLMAGAWAMDFLGGGRMGSWWTLSSSDGLEQVPWCKRVEGEALGVTHFCYLNEARKDEKDVKIRELTAELQRERKRSAAFQEQLDMVLRDMEDHSHHLSRNIDDIVQSVELLLLKIRELTAELQRERKRSAAFQEQLDMVLRDMEDHSHHLSRNIDDIVQSVREIESKRLALSHS
ncbi:hypothetical protein CFP56_006823 [Quercus suber]|uniref:Uncharacterized protein n=1 Tax=Quercus suber TaxID=58331 RepID=A0AAW0M8I8_QUESU